MRILNIDVTFDEGQTLERPSMSLAISSVKKIQEL